MAAIIIGMAVVPSDLQVALVRSLNPKSLWAGKRGDGLLFGFGIVASATFTKPAGSHRAVEGGLLLVRFKITGRNVIGSTFWRCTGG